MESFSKTQNFTGVKKNLLKGSNFKSIQQARREYPNLSDNEIYQNLLEIILRKDRQKRKRKENKRNSIFPYRNSEIEPFGQPVRKQNIQNERPFKIVIKNEVAIFLKSKPLEIKEESEILNEDKNGKHLIIWVKTENEARQKAEDINNEKYNEIWDEYGGAFRTPHNIQFDGLRFCVIIDSPDAISILLNSVIEISTPMKKKQKRNKLDEPMFLAKPYKPTFLNHFDDIDKCAFVDNQGECVLKTLYDVLNRDRRHFSFEFLKNKFNEASLFLYKRKLKKKHGITARMLKFVAEKLNLSLLGFDSNNIEFVRNTPDRSRGKRHKAIIFLMTMQHFYIITDTETINSLTRLNCDYVTDLKIDEQIKEPIFVRNVTNYDELESGTVNIIDDDLNGILRDLIEDSKQLPKVKYSSLTTVSKIDVINKNGDKIILVNPGDNNLTVDEIKSICNKAGIILIINQSGIY